MLNPKTSNLSTPAHRTHSECGQSIWYDNIQKSALENGDFRSLVTRGIRGCTSNPAIFNKAIGGSSDYDAPLERLARSGLSAEEIYVKLAIADIQEAADQLREVYDESKATDGYVSIEVHPRAAHHVLETVHEAQHLVREIARDNVMIKVPGTEAGLSALTQLIGLGVSVNVTLIFSRQRYCDVADAYITGLKQAHANGIALDGIASVASFFVSRIDTKVDDWLTSAPSRDGIDPKQLLGKTAIANAKLAYEEFERRFRGAAFAELAALGAQPQRLLWASTGTKNPAYSDTLYVDSLIGPDTVNTVPPDTLLAFQDHGTPECALLEDHAQARQQLEQLERLGLDLDSVCQTLLDDGLRSFSDAMHSLIASVAQRQQRFVPLNSGV